MNKTLKNIRDSLPKRGLLKWMWEVKKMDRKRMDFYINQMKKLDEKKYWYLEKLMLLVNEDKRI